MAKFTTPEGDFLDVVESSDGFGVSWFSGDWQGLDVAHNDDLPEDPLAKKVEMAAREWIASQPESSRSRMDVNRQGVYRFQRLTDVRKLIRYCEEALQVEGPELPDWAKQALAAGWTAPKGWKP
jgi:hypothetical protein